MTLRKWTLGIAVATAALIPLRANATDVMNLPLSPNYVPGGVITIDYGGVEASNGTDSSSNLNGGTCTGGTSIAPTGCQEEGYGVGTISALTINGKPVWDSGVLSAANPNGYALAFVLYGTADLSQVVTTPIAGTTITTSDSTGATAVGQSVTYSATSAPSTKTLSISGDGLIHLDVYYMPASETPCFALGGGCTTSNLVEATDRTGFGTVDGITNAAGGGLFAQFTFASGAQPLNTADDGSSNGLVTLAGNLIQSNIFGSSGSSRAYMDCVNGGATTPPGCSSFDPVTETYMDTTGSGYHGDPTYATDLVNAFLKNTIGFGTGPQINAGWTYNLSDPVYAVAPVPEPASLGILGTALAFFGVAVRRRRKGMSA